MGNRSLRVNELLKREISAYIHRNLQTEAAGVTIFAVESTSDFKSATAFFSVLGNLVDPRVMERLRNKHAQEINQHLRRTITLRNIPRVRFKYDIAMERGSRIVALLDEIEAEQKRRESRPS
ncbi:MAG: ribosome-binding factor A [Verrucomicrobia bacterium]|nr:MAG: ribosome-binding factor A [Verrucomicrobiota bacterium]